MTDSLQASPTGLRAWILTLACVCGLAGFAGGLLASQWFAETPEPAGAFGRYREAIVEEFDLSPERARVLASVLDEYQRHLEDLQARGLKPLEEELAKRGQQFHELIQDRVVPESQRARFKELSSSTRLPSSTAYPPSPLLQ